MAGIRDAAADAWDTLRHDYVELGRRAIRHATAQQRRRLCRLMMKNGWRLTPETLATALTCADEVRRGHIHVKCDGVVVYIRPDRLNRIWIDAEDESGEDRWPEAECEFLVGDAGEHASWSGAGGAKLLVSWVGMILEGGSRVDIYDNDAPLAAVHIASEMWGREVLAYSTDGQLW